MTTYLVTVVFADGTFIEVKVYSISECNAADFVRDYILDEIPESIIVVKG